MAMLPPASTLARRLAAPLLNNEEAGAGRRSFLASLRNTRHERGALRNFVQKKMEENG
jgi:hypothetical protein